MNRNEITDRVRSIVFDYTTLEKFAATTGVSRRTVDRWINEGSGLNLESLAKIAESNEVSLDWLVLGRDERVLKSQDELADQLWLRIRQLLVAEGAISELAEMAIPAPSELLKEVLQRYRGRGRGLGYQGGNPGAILALRGGTEAFNELELQCDALEKQLREKKAMYDSLDALRMRVAMELGKK